MTDFQFSLIMLGLVIIIGKVGADQKKVDDVRKIAIWIGEMTLYILGTLWMLGVRS